MKMLRTLQEIQRNENVSYGKAVKIQRSESLKILEKFYLENLVEDGIGGTAFDIDILKSIEKLRKIYV